MVFLVLLAAINTLIYRANCRDCCLGLLAFAVLTATSAGSFLGQIKWQRRCAALGPSAVTAACLGAVIRHVVLAAPRLAAVKG